MVAKASLQGAGKVKMAHTPICNQFLGNLYFLQCFQRCERQWMWRSYLFPYPLLFFCEKDVFMLILGVLRQFQVIYSTFFELTFQRPKTCLCVSLKDLLNFSPNRIARYQIALNVSLIKSSFPSSFVQRMCDENPFKHNVHICFH